MRCKIFIIKPIDCLEIFSSVPCCLWDGVRWKTQCCAVCSTAEQRKQFGACYLISSEKVSISTWNSWPNQHNICFGWIGLAIWSCIFILGVLCSYKRIINPINCFFCDTKRYNKCARMSSRDETKPWIMNAHLLSGSICLTQTLENFFERPASSRCCKGSDLLVSNSPFLALVQTQLGSLSQLRNGQEVGLFPRISNREFSWQNFRGLGSVVNRSAQMGWNDTLVF